jgi:hypothetical protein
VGVAAISLKLISGHMPVEWPVAVIISVILMRETAGDDQGESS